MPDKDWSKYKTREKVGTLQIQPQVQEKKDWSKYKTISREEPGKISGAKVRLTKTGHIDTRYFFKTPKWVYLK